MSTQIDISGLMKYVGRPEWAAHMQDVLEEHLGPAMHMFDVEYHDLPDLIGDPAAANLWGCAFEDLLTRFVGPDGINMVDVFLKHRGWNERVRDKIYMKALRNAVMSLYEVSNIVPGRSLLARDLLRGGDPVRVSERSATQSLKQWDKLAARVVPLGTEFVFAGGVLAFSAEAVEKVTELIHEVIGGGEGGIDDAMLRKAAPLFSSTWLMDALSRKIGDHQPRLQNSAGEDVLFHAIRFPIAKGVTQKDIARRLDEISSLQRESASFWNWLGGPAPGKPPAGAAPNALIWNVTMDDGRIVLGNIELKGRFLTLMVNSAGRASEGTAMLEKAVGGLVREPSTEIQTVDEMKAARQSREIPVEMATPAVHDLLDKEYRAVLDEPVGMLGDITPREAIRTAKGREKVAGWIKYLENATANYHDPRSPMATYDFGWIWRELEIEHLRK